MQEQKRYSEEELRYLKLLARQYPTVQSVMERQKGFTRRLSAPEAGGGA